MLVQGDRDEREWTEEQHSGLAESLLAESMIPASQSIKVWDALTGQEILSLKGHFANVVCFSPDGNRIASGGMEQTVTVWDVHTGQEILSLKGHGEIISVCFSPDGKRLASATGDGTVNIWDASGER